MAKKLQGVFAVLVTPFTKNDKIDEKALRKHVRFLLDKGKVNGLLPTGSTGEFAGLNDDERKQVADIVISEANGKVPVVVGTASVATRDMVRYSKIAEKSGADGVMVAPSYYCHPDPREMYGHYKALSEAVSTNIVLYNNPGTTGVDMQPDLIAKLAEFKNINYIKESSGDMTRVAMIQELCGNKMNIFCGCDNLSLEMFLMGAVGWVVAPANLIPKQCVQLFDLVAVKKDYAKARKLYSKVLPMFTLFETTGQYVQLVKAGLTILGRPYGKPRLPLLPSEGEPLKELKKILKSILG